jgi:hypothetical protein
MDHGAGGKIGMYRRSHMTGVVLEHSCGLENRSSCLGI